MKLYSGIDLHSNSSFLAISDEQYRFVTVWGDEGSDPGQFTSPIGIAITRQEIFVSDTGNNRIQKFSLKTRP